MRDKFHPEILTGSLSRLSGGVKQGWGGENKLLSSFVRQYLGNGTIRPKLLLMTNGKLHMRFRLAPWSMTLDDLALL